MFGYSPKLSHAMAAMILCLVCIALCEKAKGKVLDAFITGAIIFGLTGVLILWWISMESANRQTQATIDFMDAFGRLDDEARAAVAFQFPSIRYRMRRGELRQMFEDTNVTIDKFRLFLQNSNNRYISPEREWNSKEKPRWVWMEIRGWLEANGYVVADSAAGSHSWLWTEGSYQRLFAYWMAGRKPVSADSRVYAYEEKL